MFLLPFALMILTGSIAFGSRERFSFGASAGAASSFLDLAFFVDLAAGAAAAAAGAGAAEPSAAAGAATGSGGADSPFELPAGASGAVAAAPSVFGVFAFF